MGVSIRCRYFPYNPFLSTWYNAKNKSVAAEIQLMSSVVGSKTCATVGIKLLSATSLTTEDKVHIQNFNRCKNIIKNRIKKTVLSYEMISGHNVCSLSGDKIENYFVFIRNKNDLTGDKVELARGNQLLIRPRAQQLVSRHPRIISHCNKIYGDVKKYLKFAHISSVI